MRRGNIKMEKNYFDSLIAYTEKDIRTNNFYKEKYKKEKNIEEATRMEELNKYLLKLTSKLKDFSKSWKKTVSNFPNAAKNINNECLRCRSGHPADKLILKELNFDYNYSYQGTILHERVNVIFWRCKQCEAETYFSDIQNVYP